MRVEYKPERGRYDAAVRRAHTGAQLRAAAPPPIGGAREPVARPPPPVPPLQTTSNSYSCSLPRPLLPLRARALCARTSRNLIDMRSMFNVNLVFDV